MTTLVLIFFIVAVVALLLVAGMQPQRPSLSVFELRRRAETAKGDSAAARRLQQALHYDDILVLLGLVRALLLVLGILLSVAAFGWLVGVIVAVVLSLSYAALAKLPPLPHLGCAAYRRAEDTVLVVAAKASPVLRFLGDHMPVEAGERAGSKEELAHIIAGSADILSPTERRLLTHGLSFAEKRVSEVMTPRSVVDTVESTEVLGPLMLDKLYKLGHSRLPVINGDIDHVVGVLYVQDLLTVSATAPETAAQAMDPHVFYIREDHTLEHALVAFLRTKHHLCVVVNEYRETVGVVSLEDVLEALLGKEIVDEFDAHDDLRAVAAHNPRGNNKPSWRTDV